jgi:hypothetical protein
MVLQLIANHEQIISAINEFDSGYHADYFGIRHLATAYLDAPIPTNTAPLAEKLNAVFPRWGAGKRGAPRVKSEQDIQVALMGQAMHKLLLEVTRAPVPALTLTGGTTRTVNGVGSMSALARFDYGLLVSLRALADSMFVGNTNVTYPMKALLLLTGIMPALDSQVRKGLGKAGFSGVDKTQFLIPQNTACVDGM